MIKGIKQPATVWSAVAAPHGYDYLLFISQTKGVHYSEIMKQFNSGTLTRYVLRKLMESGLVIKRQGKFLDSWKIYVTTQRGETVLQHIDKMLVAMA
jgi:predicted transcriptional regulator